MWKSQFKGRTEDESFTFIANPMHLRQTAAIILAQHGAKFVEISDMNGLVLMIASQNPDAKSPDAVFNFCFPADSDEEE